MKLKTLKLEVRGVEEKMSKKTGNPYLLVRVEDEEGAWMNLVDRDSENKELYKKGNYYDFMLDIQIRKEYTSVSVIDMNESVNIEQ